MNRHKHCPQPWKHRGTQTMPEGVMFVGRYIDKGMYLNGPSMAYT